MKRKNAFTLIELLVVISIIALLVAILMPALNKAREQATGSVCLGNQKSMILAWVMYADENNGRLVGGNTFNGATTPNWYDSYNRWCENPKASDRYGGDPPSGSGNDYVGLTAGMDHTLSDEYRKNGIRAGKLFEYLDTVDVYQCPGDKSWSKFNPPYDKFRSYSITGAMNGEDIRNHNGGNGYRKLSDIKRASEKYVFVEETNKRQTFLAGSFQVRTNGFTDVDNSSTGFWDNLSKWHNYRNTFNFADGHAEMKEWNDRRTRWFLDQQVSVGNLVFDENAPVANVSELTHSGSGCNNDDFKWLFNGYGQKGQ